MALREARWRRRTLKATACKRVGGRCREVVGEMGLRDGRRLGNQPKNARFARLSRALLTK